MATLTIIINDIPDEYIAKMKNGAMMAALVGRSQVLQMTDELKINFNETIETGGIAALVELTGIIKNSFVICSYLEIKKTERGGGN